MKSLAFIVKNLSIRKLPGFPEGLKIYSDFASNINIITGPNASGKSSTARAIKQLIWPFKTDGIFVESSAEIEDQKWDIKIDSKNVKIQRQGVDDVFPGIPAFETSKRYDLALHELIKDEDQDIAAEILRQSSGGYNLDKANLNLGYSKRIKDKGAKEYKDYAEAKNNLNDISQRHKDLQKEEERLNILKDKYSKTKESLVLKGLYENLRYFLLSKSKSEIAKVHFQSFPPEMEKLHGNEFDDIESLEAEIDKATRSIETGELKIGDCNEKLKTINIPEEGVPDSVIDEQDERLGRIQEYERKIKEADLKIKGLKAQEMEALKSINNTIDLEKWDGLNLKKINELDQFLENAHKTVSEKQFLETELEELNKEIIDTNYGAEVLNEGIRSLNLWLQEQDTTSGSSKRLTLYISLVSILTAILVFIIGWPGLLGILVIIILSYFSLKNTPGSDNTVRKNDYDKTELPQPDIWTNKGVSDKLEDLIDELNKVKWQNSIIQRITRNKAEIDNLKPRLDKLNDTYNDWLQDLNAMPELPGSDLKNYTGLFWFIAKVNEWQKAHTQKEVSIAERTFYSEKYEEELEKLNQSLDSYTKIKADDYIKAKSIFNSLRESENNRRELKKESEYLTAQLEEFERQKKSFLRKSEDIYSKMNLTFGEKEKLKRLILNSEEYKKSKGIFQDAEAILNEKEMLLKDHSLFSKHKEEIELISIDQAEVKLKEFEEDVNQSESLNKQITEIETNISNAKGGNTLGSALNNEEKALSNLEQLYEDNLSSSIGDIIINQLKERSKNHNQPHVLVRSNELFTNITSGRYNLLVGTERVPAMRAYDNLLKQGLDLNELSTGTRIQLLLSVRIAFIEMQEGIIKLPILADELLANSDDIRAKAIIEALIKISKEGRQVFYFTAQADEVSKWKLYLESEKDIKFKIFELEGGQNETMLKKGEGYEFSSLDIIQAIPSPKNKSHQEYGLILNITPFNILTQDTEQLDIWFLTRDNDLIYNCLKNGIHKWGQLSSFLNNNGKVDGMDEDSIRIFHEKALLMERFIELYRRGRPRMIDREILEKSEAVSSSFIDLVNSKLEELIGDPVKLIKALKNKEVNGFRMTKAEELEQYLITATYIDDRESLGKEEILVRLNAFLSNTSLSDSEAHDFINNILKSNSSEN